MPARKKKSDMTLDEQLNVFKIKKAVYEDYKEKLLGLGYSQEQVDKVVLRKSSKKTVETLISVHQTLLDKGYNREQLIQIASHDGGSNNLQAVIDNHEALLNLKFTLKQIVKIVSQGGGSKKLLAMVENNITGDSLANKNSKRASDGQIKTFGVKKSDYDSCKEKLLGLGYSQEQANKVVDRKSSKKTVEKLISVHQTLLDKGYNRKQLIQIASHDGGSNNFQAVIDNHEALINLNFTLEQIVKMASHDGGFNNLVAVIDNHEALINLKFTLDQIVKMVSHGGGSNNLQAVIDNHEALINLKFTLEQIVKMASHDGGSKNLQAILENYEALIKLNFTAVQIVEQVSHGGGSKKLLAMVKNNIKGNSLTNNKSEITLDGQLITIGIKKSDYEDYKEKLLFLGYSQEQVDKVVLRESSKKTVETLISVHQTLLAKGYNRVQLIQIASHDGGSNNLQAVIDNHEALINLNFTLEQIVKMASHDGGSKNLQAVLENYEALIKLNFTAVQIVEQVSRGGGSKKLLVMVENNITGDSLTKNKSDITLDGQLNTFRIKKSDYDSCKEKLLGLGYSQEQVDKVVFRKSSKKTVEKLISVHQALLDKGYNREQLIQIASHNGGSNNLQAVIDNHEALINLKFTLEQIVKMVSHGGGSINLQVVIEKHDALLLLNFNDEQIVKMVSHDGGSKNLQAVLENHDALMRLNFTAEQIVEQVSRGGGSKKLLAMVENNITGYSLTKNKSDITLDGQLNTFGIKKSDYEDYKEKLLFLGYSQEQVDKLILRKSPANTIETLIKRHQELLERGYNREQLVQMASNGGSNSLQAVIDNHEALINLNFTLEQIVKIVSHGGCSKNLLSALILAQGDRSINIEALRSVIFAGDIAGTLLSRLRLLANRKTYDGVFFNDNMVTLTLKETCTDIEALSFVYALHVLYQLNSEFRRLFERPNLISPFKLQLTAEGVNELKERETLLYKLVACASKLVQFYPLTLTSRGELWELSGRACELKLNSAYLHPVYARRIRGWLSRLYSNSIMSLHFERPTNFKKGILSLKLKPTSLPDLNDELAKALFFTIINIESKWRNKKGAYLEFCRKIETEQFGEDKAKIIFNKLALEYSDLNKGIPRPLFEHCLKQKFLQLLDYDKTQHYIENEDGVFDLSFVGNDLVVSLFINFLSYISTSTGLDNTIPKSSTEDENLAETERELDNFMEQTTQVNAFGDDMDENTQVNAFGDHMEDIEQMIKDLDTYFATHNAQQPARNDGVCMDELLLPGVAPLVFSPVYNLGNSVEPLMDDEPELLRSILGLNSN